MPVRLRGSIELLIALAIALFAIRSLSDSMPDVPAQELVPFGLFLLLPSGLALSGAAQVLTGKSRAQLVAGWAALSPLRKAFIALGLFASLFALSYLAMHAFP